MKRTLLLWMLCVGSSHADLWYDSSTSTRCSVSVQLPDAKRIARVMFSWERGSKTGTVLEIISGDPFLYRGGKAVIESPSLGAGWTLDSSAHLSGAGKNADLLRADIAKGRPWKLELYPAGKPARTVVAERADAAIVVAMFDACRGFSERAPAPASPANYVRAENVRAEFKIDACLFDADYRKDAFRALLRVMSIEGTTVAQFGGFGNENAGSIDLTALGGPSNQSLPYAPRKPLPEEFVATLMADLLAGRERIVPVRDPDGRKLQLVFGGIEFRIEAAMFAACAKQLQEAQLTGAAR